MFYVLMAILATAVAVLMFNHEAGQVFGYPIEMVASVTVLCSWLLYLLSGRMGHWGSLTKTLKQAATWILIGFGLILAYSFKDDAKMMISRVGGELVPGMGIERSDGSVSFRRADNGHFMVRATIDNVTLPMLVDSGASSIVLSYEDAKSIGIDADNLRFSTPVSTANGRAFAAQVRLNSLAVGGIELRRVPAMVSQQGALNSSLLGLTFLDKLDSWSVTGDRLTMTP